MAENKRGAEKQIKIEVDVSDSIAGLKKLQREIRETIADIKELERATNDSKAITVNLQTKECVLSREDAIKLVEQCTKSINFDTKV